MHLTERKEDMSPRGFLRILMEDDGDIIVAVGQCDRDGIVDPVARVEFCSIGSGGGRSPRTRDALIQLMAAIAADNLDSTCSARRGEHLNDADEAQIIKWVYSMSQDSPLAAMKPKRNIIDDIL